MITPTPLSRYRKRSSNACLNISSIQIQGSGKKTVVKGIRFTSSTLTDTNLKSIPETGIPDLQRAGKSRTPVWYFLIELNEKMNPFTKFQKWYESECITTDTLIPSACCLSTTGTDGYPNARFVSLKELKDEQFIITGPMDSRKGNELRNKPRAALTFWWPATGRQVRVQGDVRQIDIFEADRYFSERSRESQIVSWASKQGKPLKNNDSLKEQFNHYSNLHANKQVPRPENWGGWEILPIRIEFLEFDANRYHNRVLYVKSIDGWHPQNLQP